MRGVPADLDLRSFIGSRLDQLCLGPYDVQLRFSSGQIITIEGSWRLDDGKGAIIDESVGRASNENGSRSRSGWRIRDLLSDIVGSTRIDSPMSFSLGFESGRRLTVLDDSDEFESFAIQPGDIFV